jgi:predicted ester cyclase
MRIFNLIARIYEAFLNGINKKRAKDAANDPASNVANNDSLRESETSFSELARESKRHKTK